MSAVFSDDLYVSTLRKATPEEWFAVLNCIKVLTKQRDNKEPDLFLIWLLQAGLGCSQTQASASSWALLHEPFVDAGEMRQFIPSAEPEPLTNSPYPYQVYVVFRKDGGSIKLVSALGLVQDYNRIATVYKLPATDPYFFGLLAGLLVAHDERGKGVARFTLGHVRDEILQRHADKTARRLAVYALLADNVLAAKVLREDEEDRLPEAGCFHVPTDIVIWNGPGTLLRTLAIPTSQRQPLTDTASGQFY